MPSIAIHEAVANRLSFLIEEENYDYYLGVLAPDAPNLNGFAPKEERWTAHVRKKDLKDWRESLKKFYQREKTHYSKDFILGYILHILTDIVYDDYYYREVRNKIEQDGYAREESHSIMVEDMKQYKENSSNQWKNILKKKNDSYDILNISKETLIQWKKMQIERKETNSKYISKELVDSLTERVKNELPKILKESK